MGWSEYPAPYDKVSIIFRKLADGGWGLYGPKEKLIEGEEVEAHKADGKKVTETVGTVLWTGRKYALAELGDQPPKELLA